MAVLLCVFCLPSLLCFSFYTLYGALWCSMVLYGALRCSMVLYGALRCSTVLYGALWCSMVWLCMGIIHINDRLKAPTKSTVFVGLCSALCCDCSCNACALYIWHIALSLKSIRIHLSPGSSCGLVYFAHTCAMVYFHYGTYSYLLTGRDSSLMTYITRLGSLWGIHWSKQF